MRFWKLVSATISLLSVSVGSIAATISYNNYGVGIYSSSTPALSQVKNYTDYSPTAITSSREASINIDKYNSSLGELTGATLSWRTRNIYSAGNGFIDGNIYSSSNDVTNISAVDTLFNSEAKYFIDGYQLHNESYSHRGGCETTVRYNTRERALENRCSYGKNETHETGIVELDLLSIYDINDLIATDVNDSITLSVNAIDSINMLCRHMSEPTDYCITAYKSSFVLLFDIEYEYIEHSVVPVPAAVWLFGSGLIGIAGIARRKKA